MKYILFSIFFSFVISQCPLPGVNFSPSTNFEASFATGFKVTVSCAGIATGINVYTTNNIQVALYLDDNNHPTTRIAISNFVSGNGLTTINFQTPVQVSPGHYWLFADGQAILGGCLGCSAVSNVQIIGLYGLNSLDASYANNQFNTFGVGQLGYSMWLNVVTGTACSFDWECASSGANYGFATCVSGFCACRPNFIGSAIPQDACRCDVSSGNHLAYDQNGNPNCLNAGVCQVGDLVRVDLCSDYTQNYMFVSCNSGQCQCISGFQGTATASDQCRCDFTLTWTVNGPVCSQ